ncbi:MAG TPA: carbohydrate kinase family protein [Bryobacteraceae bacterium]|nr:carbohydrate kinase family protein [Bryobacteraceae bacterium]
MSAGVLCSGSIVFDILVRPVNEVRWGTTNLVETIEYHVGGNGANTTIALASLGVPARLIGTVGNDDQARLVCARLQSAGVDTRWLRAADAPTAASIAVVNQSGERMFLHRLGASNVAFSSPVDFPLELLDGMRHYHLASLFVLPRLREHAAETLMRARRAGLATSLDTNWDPQGRWMRDLAPCLPHLDFLFVNEDEARMITGESSPSDAAPVLLSKGTRVVVIKLGASGCAIHTADRAFTCRGFAVDAKDTTGAGDCFVAGFLAARARGESLVDAGRFANAVAAKSVEKIGGAVGIPSYEEVKAWANSISCGAL